MRLEELRPGVIISTGGNGHENPWFILWASPARPISLSNGNRLKLFHVDAGVLSREGVKMNHTFSTFSISFFDMVTGQP